MKDSEIFHEIVRATRGIVVGGEAAAVARVREILGVKAESESREEPESTTRDRKERGGRTRSSE